MLYHSESKSAKEIPSHSCVNIIIDRLNVDVGSAIVVT